MHYAVKLKFSSRRIGEARNALVARTAFCLVVIGNSSGNLSEIALGLAVRHDRHRNFGSG